MRPPTPEHTGALAYARAASRAGGESLARQAGPLEENRR